MAHNGASWGWYNFSGGLFGALQVAGGIFLTVSTGGIGTYFGAGLISSGLNGAIYSLTSDNEEIEADEFFKTSVVGGVQGIVTGGFCSIAGASASMATRFGFNALGGVAGRVASVVTDGTVHDKEIDINFSILASSAVSGAVGGAISSKASQVIPDKLAKITQDKMGRTIIGGIFGATTGIAKGTATQLLSNKIEGRKDLTQGLGIAVITGSVIDGAFGAIDGRRLETNRKPDIIDGDEDIPKTNMSRPIEKNKINSYSISSLFSSAKSLFFGDKRRKNGIDVFYPVPLGSSSKMKVI